MPISVSVLSQTGRKHSDLLTEQRNQVGGGLLGGPLRYEKTLVIWVQCEQETLDDRSVHQRIACKFFQWPSAKLLMPRCDKRVDKMMERGMLKELEDYHAHYNSARGALADYTVGIFQSIGFKEFHNYLKLDTEEQKGPLGQKFFEPLCCRLDSCQLRGDVLVMVARSPMFFFYSRGASAHGTSTGNFFGED